MRTDTCPQTIAKMINVAMKVGAVVGLIVLLGCGDSPNDESEITMSERYPPPWRHDFNLGISKALASKKIRDCGEYKYRESSRDKGEYLVHCTRDGKRWNAYLVWSRIEEVNGPFAPDPLLK